MLENVLLENDIYHPQVWRNLRELDAFTNAYILTSLCGRENAFQQRPSLLPHPPPSPHRDPPAYAPAATDNPPADAAPADAAAARIAAGFREECRRAAADGLRRGWTTRAQLGALDPAALLGVPALALFDLLLRRSGGNKQRNNKITP